jgi:hypothetical protein
MYGGVSALDMEFSHILNNADEWHTCAWMFAPPHPPHLIEHYQFSALNIPRYSRRPSASPDDAHVIDQHGRDGLLRRVLNSGLLLREGYMTPEAGVFLPSQP